MNKFIDARRLLAPTMHARWPGVMFALGLLCRGLNSMIIGMLAGETVMEGFLALRISAMRRALLMCALALGLTLLVAMAYGGRGSTCLLVASQVLLSLPFSLVMASLFYFACIREARWDWRFRSPRVALARDGALPVPDAAILRKWKTRG